MVTRTSIRGLRVSSALGDVQDPVQALENLNLSILDLDRIRGISSEGVTSDDLKTLSGLTFDVEKTLIAIEAETRTYENLLKNANDGRNLLRSNLVIDGRILSPSFKFKQYDASDDSIKSTDISTSRASAWSSFGDPSISISYGGEVRVEGKVELDSLNFYENQAIARRFESQIATHQIEVELNGEVYKLYAMKGIPLIFEGFFKDLRSLRADVTNAGPGPGFLRPSWIIRDVDTNAETVYRNRISPSGTTRSSVINFFSSSSKQRSIEFYYPVNNVIRLDIQNANISEFPSVTLPNLQTLNAVGNNLFEMPNFSNITPGLLSLNISNNNLTRSSTNALRNLSDDVIQRLPSTLVTLTMGNTYANANQTSVGLALLPALRNFSCARTSENSRRISGTSPAIGSNLLVYNIGGNLFTSVDPSILNSANIEDININLNNISGDLAFGANPNAGANLKFWRSGNQSHGILNVTGKTNLEFYQHRSANIGSGFKDTLIEGGDSIFTGCTSLRIIDMTSTTVTGNLPIFETNDSLESIDLGNTRITGSGSGIAISNTTFGPRNSEVRKSMRFFSLASILLQGIIEPNVFENMPNISTITVSCYGRAPGVTGTILNNEGISIFRECPSLRTLNIPSNYLTGTLPRFTANQQLRFINVSWNRRSATAGFIGAIPSYSLPFLDQLYLQGNRFTSFESLSCPNLRILDASYNFLAGPIPNLEESFRLLQVNLSNNPSFNSYTRNNFSRLTLLQRLNLSNCNLNRNIVHDILRDLQENYNARNRRGVVIDLTGNAAPDLSVVGSIITDLRNVGWTIGVAT